MGIEDKSVSQEPGEGRIEPEPWKAGGYSIWATSKGLAEIIKPIAYIITKNYGSMFPVDDGHLTILGNIGKGETDELKVKGVESQLKIIVSELKTELIQTPIQLKFTDFYSDGSKPSQTLCLVAESISRWKDLFLRVREKLGLEPTDNIPMIHASIVYNYASENPLNTKQIRESLLPMATQSLTLPITEYVDDVAAIKTQGVPADWKRIA